MSSNFIKINENEKINKRYIQTILKDIHVNEAGEMKRVICIFFKDSMTPIIIDFKNKKERDKFFDKI